MEESTCLTIGECRAIVEKERRKQKKLAKDAENQSTNAGTLGNVTTTPKTKEKKAKQDSVKEESMVEYHEETPPGQKKSRSQLRHAN